MFPSSHNGNVDPIYYSDQQGYVNRPFFNDITSNSKHDQDHDQIPISLFQLPNIPFSFIYDQLELQDHDIFHEQSHDLLFQHQQQQQQQALRGIAADASIFTATTTAVVNMEDFKKYSDENNELMKGCSTKQFHSSTTSNGEMIINITAKRSSKRDRHSKINTAQGLRDRRMRLSLKVARDFFDLQDKLCFDKASKTVEWLLLQAKPAIKKLSNSTGLPQMNCSCSTVATNNTKSASSTSECEVVSEFDEAAADASKGSSKISKGKGKPSSSTSHATKGKKKAKPSRKSAFNPLAKEWREKARARARERTREKKHSSQMDESNSKLREEEAKSHQLNCWRSFETTGEQQSGIQSHTMNNSNNNNNNKPALMEMMADIEEEPVSSHDQQQQDGSLITKQGTIDHDSLMIMGKWSPSFTINHLYQYY